MFKKQGYSFVNAQKYTFLLWHFISDYSGAILSQQKKSYREIKSGMIFFFSFGSHFTSISSCLYLIVLIIMRGIWAPVPFYI